MPLKFELKCKPSDNYKEKMPSDVQYIFTEASIAHALSEALFSQH